MSKTGGCLGCLGSLVVFTLFGSMFFGGGVLMRVGGLGFSLGKNPIDEPQIINNYFKDLENDKKLAEKAVQKFHMQLAQEKCQEIYQQANERFRSIYLSQSETVDNCKKLNRQFGTVSSAQLRDWWGAPVDKDSKYILLRYVTTFSKSSGREDFIWLVKNGKTELVDYEPTILSNVTSPSPSPSPSSSPSPQ